jgi:HD-like signal output (HDOD) protein
MHAEHGARLLQQWNIPELYCDVVRDHHKADYDPNNTTLTMVRLVNLACHKLGIGLQHDPLLVLATTGQKPRPWRPQNSSWQSSR